jgi:hypothetical protein
VINYRAMDGPAGRRRQAQRIAWWCGAAGVIGLALLGLAYALTHEPAPRVRVEWDASVTAQQRMALEQKYLLASPRDVIGHGSMAYDLLDTSAGNIKALVDDPAIADTNDIDRDAYAIPFDTEYGLGWMWIAHRTPGLRDGRVRAIMINALTAMAVGGVAIAFFLRRRSTARTRANTAPRSPLFPAATSPGDGSHR